MIKMKGSILVIISTIVAIASVLLTLLFLQISGFISTEKISIEVKALDTSYVYDGLEHTPDNIYYDEKLLQSGDFIELNGYNSTITNVGEAAISPNVSIKNSDGYDVSRNYSIKYTPGIVTISKRPIKIKAKDISAIYTSNVIKSSDFEIEEGSLVKGHIISPNFITSITDVTSQEGVESILTTDIYDINGIDVSSNYDIINSNDGKIIISKNTININIQNITKTFDNKPITIDDIKYTFNTQNSISKLSLELEFDEDSISNMIYSKVYDLIPINYHFSIDGNNVSNDNFICAITEGKLTINKYKGTVITKSTTATYDGNNHNCFEYNLSPDLDYFLKENKFDSEYIDELYEDLRLNSSIVQFVDSYEKGYENNFKINILDENKNVITENFDLYYLYGEILITKRDLSIETKSESFIFDNQEHSSEQSSEKIEGLLDNHIIKFLYKTELKNVGSVDNEIEIINIIDENENDVSKNYNLKIKNGKLEINKKNVLVTTKNVIEEFSNEALNYKDKIKNDSKYNNQFYSINNDTASMFENNNLELNVDFKYDGKIIYVENDYYNVISFEVLYQAANNPIKENITDNFNFSFQNEEDNQQDFGKIKINPKKIYIKPNSISKDYDQKAITNEIINFKFYEIDKLTEFEFPKDIRVELLELSYNDTAKGIINVEDKTNYKPTEIYNLGLYVIHRISDNRYLTNNYVFELMDYDDYSIEITPRVIREKDLEVSSLEYNGYEQCPTITYANDSNLEIGISTTYTNAGSYCLNKEDLNLTNFNYKLDEDIEIPFEISRKKINIALKNPTEQFTGEYIKPEFESDDICDNDSLNLNINDSYKDPGIYIINIDKPTSGNYDYDATELTFKIQIKNVNATLSKSNFDFTKKIDSTVSFTLEDNEVNISSEFYEIKYYNSYNEEVIPFLPGEYIAKIIINSDIIYADENAGENAGKNEFTNYITITIPANINFNNQIEDFNGTNIEYDIKNNVSLSFYESGDKNVTENDNEKKYSDEELKIINNYLSSLEIKYKGNSNDLKILIPDINDLDENELILYKNIKGYFFKDNLKILFNGNDVTDYIDIIDIKEESNNEIYFGINKINLSEFNLTCIDKITGICFGDDIKISSGTRLEYKFISNSNDDSNNIKYFKIYFEFDELDITIDEYFYDIISESFDLKGYGIFHYYVMYNGMEYAVDNLISDDISADDSSCVSFDKRIITITSNSITLKYSQLENINSDTILETYCNDNLYDDYIKDYLTISFENDSIEKSNVTKTFSNLFSVTTTTDTLNNFLSIQCIPGTITIEPDDITINVISSQFDYGYDKSINELITFYNNDPYSEINSSFQNKIKNNIVVKEYENINNVKDLLPGEYIITLDSNEINDLCSDYGYKAQFNENYIYIKKIDLKLEVNTKEPYEYDSLSTYQPEEVASITSSIEDFPIDELTLYCDKEIHNPDNYTIYISKDDLDNYNDIYNITINSGIFTIVEKVVNNDSQNVIEISSEFVLDINDIYLYVSTNIDLDELIDYNLNLIFGNENEFNQGNIYVFNIEPEDSNYKITNNIIIITLI